MELWVILAIVTAILVMASITVYLHHFLISNRQARISQISSKVLLGVFLMLLVIMASCSLIAVLTHYLTAGLHDFGYFISMVVVLINFIIQITVAIHSDDICKLIHEKTK